MNLDVNLVLRDGIEEFCAPLVKLMANVPHQRTLSRTHESHILRGQLCR